MGYFRIMAAIPGFFISSLLLMLLWDAIAPKLGWGGYRLCHRHADNHHGVAGGSAAGGGRQEKIEGLLAIYYLW
jgi:hypothetical protein